MTTYKKYTAHQLDQMLWHDFEKFDKIKITSKNHQHDYTDPDAKKYSVEKGYFQKVCCWCGKPIGQHEKTWRNRK